MLFGRPLPGLTPLEVAFHWVCVAVETVGFAVFGVAVVSLFASRSVGGLVSFAVVTVMLAYLGRMYLMHRLERRIEDAERKADQA